MKTYLPWIFDSEFILNIHIRIRYSNNYDRIALFVFVFVLILRMNTIRIRIRFIFRKRILFVFVFVPKSLFVPTLVNIFQLVFKSTFINYLDDGTRTRKKLHIHIDWLCMLLISWFNKYRQTFADKCVSRGKQTYGTIIHCLKGSPKLLFYDYLLSFLNLSRLLRVCTLSMHKQTW